MLFSVPLRSLFRNRRRTLLSVAIIALGTAMSFLVLGYTDYSLSTIEGVLAQEFGNLQIASPLLWQEETENYKHLIGAGLLTRVAEILRRHPEVVGYSPQLSFSGLAVYGDLTKVIQATGVVPGNRALDYNELVVEGRGLEPEDRGQVLVGRTLADGLGLSPGDFFNLTVTTVDGQYNVGPLQVGGIYRYTSQQFESQRAFLPLDYGKLLLNTDGVDRIIVGLADLSATDRVAAALQGELDQESLELEVRTWKELSSFYGQIKGFFGALFGFLTLAVTVLVFFIVLQVLTMSFFERTREVGTIRALGTKRYEVFRLFFMESLFLGASGTLAGLLLGLLLGGGFNLIGFGWRPPGTIEPVRLAVTFSWANAWPPFLIGVAATMLSALFPSWRTARLPVVEALRST